ncbi:MAG: 6-pyruvoyl trahydropterin synthase family protein [Elusimicrobiales bacterium]
MYKVKKTFHLAYGHRLLNYNGKCENLHGHNGVVEISLKSETLNSERMVMDFTELGAKVKGWLDANLDHMVILAKADPLAPLLAGQGQKCFLTDENPTAEVLARVIYEAARKDLGLPVSKVAFWETPTSMAAYKN